MKTLFTISVTIFISLSLLAQDKQKKRSIQEYKSISKRDFKLERSVPDLLAEAEILRAKNPKAALGMVEEALAQSITQRSRFNEAKCYIQLGKINQQIKEWELARQNYSNAIEILNMKSYTSTNEYRQTLDGLIKVNTELGNYSNSMHYLDIQQSSTLNANEKIKSYLNAADVYFLAENNTSALTKVEKANQLLSKQKNPVLKSRSQAIKAKILAKEGNIDEAKILYQQGQAVERGFGEDLYNQNIISYEESKKEIINAYSKNQQLDDEIIFRNELILEENLKLEPLKFIKEKRALGTALISKGNTSKAIHELEGAAYLADSIGNFREIASTNKALAKLWNQRGNKSKSLSYYKTYSDAIDSVFETEKRQQIEKESILKKQQEIEALRKDIALDDSKLDLRDTSHELEKNQRLLIYVLLALLMVAILAAILIYRNAIKTKTMSQLLTLKSLRSQMNPHFIFNALNSVNQFIALNDERAANKFLSEFSKLMRLVLDNSQQDFISLTEEKEIISLYLKLEHLRFRDKFEYELNFEDSLSTDAFEIPPMLVQPYVENAIWHGLRYKKTKGKLSINFSIKEKKLCIEIVDNGIGRKKSKELKTDNQKKHKSTGLKNTEERIRIINKVYQKNFTMDVSDVKTDGTGTKVTLHLPQ